MRTLFPLVGVLVLAAGCSTIHGIKPVGRGVVRPEISVGGPITEVYGAPIPIPISQLGATYGLDDRTDLHAAWHTSAAGFYNVFGADAGVSRQLLAPAGARPRLMVDGTLLAFAGDNEPGSPPDGAAGGFRLFVQPTVTGSWDWGAHDRQTTYVALTAMFQPFPEIHLLPALAVGNAWALGPRAAVTTELTWLAFTQSNLPVVPVYYAPGNIGALGLHLGFSYAIGKLPDAGAAP